MPQNKDSVLITSNKLFAGVKETELKFNLNQKEITVVREGEVIFQNGDSSEIIYLLIDGEVKLKFPNPAGAPVIENKKKNDFFGEKEFIEKTLRKSSAVAETNCLVFKLTRGDYFKLISQNKEIKKNLPDDNIFETSQNYFSDFPVRKNSKKQWIIEPEVNPNEHQQEEAKPQTENIIEPGVSDIINSGDEPVKEISTNEENVNENLVEPEIEVEENKDEENLGWDFSSQHFEENNSLPEHYSSAEQNGIDTNWDFSEPVEPLHEEAPIKFEEHQTIDEIKFYNILDTLKKINSSLQIGQVSEQIIKESLYLTGAENGRIYFKDKDQNEFYGLVPGTNERNEISIKVNEGLTGISAAENQIINLNKPAEDFRYSAPVDNPGDDYLKNLLCFPFSNDGGDVIALLELFNSSNEVFGEEEINLLSHIAPNIAQAIDNALGSWDSPNGSQLTSVSKIADFLIGDLKSPISLIKNYSDFIRKKNISGEINPILAMINSQADLINDSLQTMINFITGKSALTLQKENFNSVMNDVLVMLAEYVELRKVKLYKKFSGGAFVNIDKKVFYQACYQITKNACDAMPDGGEIFIITKTAGDSVTVEFRDTGTGIPEAIQTKIFEPFFTFGKGNKAGVGLSIAEKIIKDLNGNISISKSEGSGAIVSISLPAVN
ncbi:MAG: ATP-binding protein [Ignavibacteriaceae bacterium]